GVPSPTSTVTLWVDSEPSAESPRALSGSTYLVTSPATRSFLRIPSASAARSSLSTALVGKRTNSAPWLAGFFGISERYPEISESQAGRAAVAAIAAPLPNPPPADGGRGPEESSHSLPPPGGEADRKSLLIP